VARLKVARISRTILNELICGATKVARLKRPIFHERVSGASKKPFSTSVFVARLKVTLLKRTTKKHGTNTDILSKLMVETCHILRKTPTSFVMPVRLFLSARLPMEEYK